VIKELEPRGLSERLQTLEQRRLLGEVVTEAQDFPTLLRLSKLSGLTDAGTGPSTGPAAASAPTDPLPVWEEAQSFQ